MNAAGFSRNLDSETNFPVGVESSRVYTYIDNPQMD
jgi:hypothetical protein